MRFFSISRPLFKVSPSIKFGARVVTSTFRASDGLSCFGIIARLNFFNPIGTFGFMIIKFFALFSFDIKIFAAARLEPHETTNSAYVFIRVSYVFFSRHNFMHLIQPWHLQLEKAAQNDRAALKNLFLNFTSITTILVSSNL